MRDLAETAPTIEVVIADFNKDKAEALAKKLGYKNLTPCFADITKQSQLIDLLKGCQVVINSTPYNFNVAVMESGIKRLIVTIWILGGSFIRQTNNLSSISALRTRHWLALRHGRCTGHDLCHGQRRQLASWIKSSQLILPWVVLILSKQDHPLAPPYAIDTILDEYTKEPMVFEMGALLPDLPCLAKLQ